MMQFKSVCFDLFDTLIIFDDNRYHADLSNIAKILGFDTETFHQAFRRTQDAALAGIFETVEDRYQAILNQINHFSESNLNELIRLENEALLNCVTLVPGVQEMLISLVSHGKTLAVISNSSATGLKIMDLLKISKHFDEKIFSFIEKIAKPDPAIYLLGCDRLGTLPEDVAFVSDGDKNELEGAAKAGITPVRFDPSRQYESAALPPGTYECRSVEELTHFLLI
ncbi:HAD family hydrolase [bacterium]|nr:HAD family hydrolase [candidate division CSSED10-310 bacterium]